MAPRLSGPRFILRAAFATMFAAYAWWALGDWNRGLTSPSARATAALTRSSGLDAAATGGPFVAVGQGSFTFEVTPGCTGFSIVLLGLAAIFAYPASWKQRGVAVALAVPILVALNFVRLVTMAWVGARQPEWFEPVHVIGWQAVLIGSMALLWMAWLHHLQPGKRQDGGLRPFAILWRFVAWLPVVAVAAVWLGIPKTLGRAVYASTVAAADWLLGWRVGTSPETVAWQGLALFGSLAVALALFLASHTRPWQSRLAGFALLASPLAFSLTVAANVWQAATTAWTVDERTWREYVVFAAQNLGTLVVWWLWLRRPPCSRVGKGREPAAGRSGRVEASA